MPPVEPDRAAGGVLEGRDGVEERDVPTHAQLGLERVEIETLVVHRERHDLRAFPRQDLQRSIVGRALDEHAARPLRELDGGVEDEALQPAGRQEDLSGLDAVPFREQLPERAVAAARAVGEDRDPVALERRAGTIRDQGLIEAFRRRSAAGERDRCHVEERTGTGLGACMGTGHGVESEATAIVVIRESA